MNAGMWPLAVGEQADTVLLLRALEDFAGAFAALRDLAQLASTQVAPMDDAAFDGRIARATTGSLDGLDDERREAIARAGLSWMEALAALPQEEFGAGLGMPVASATGHARIAAAGASFSALLAAYPDIDHSGEFVIGFLDALTATRHAEVMHRSIIIAAVGAFEQLVRALMLLALQHRQPTVSEAAVRAALAHGLRGGYRNWDRWIQEHIGGISILAQTSDPRAIVEIFERRHLLVHNAAVVDARYARRTGATTSIDTEVSTDGAYVAQTLDVLVVAGLRLTFAAGRALASGLAHTLGVLIHHVVRRHLLERQAWAAADAIYAYLATAADTQALRDLARVHGWHAGKQTAGVGAITDEVEAWVSPSADFDLARLCLLERRIEALDLARQLLASGALTRIDLRSSPVLAWMLQVLDNDRVLVTVPSQT